MTIEEDNRYRAVGRTLQIIILMIAPGFGTPISTKEIADRLGTSYRTALRLIQAMERAGFPFKRVLMHDKGHWTVEPTNFQEFLASGKK